MTTKIESFNMLKVKIHCKTCFYKHNIQCKFEDFNLRAHSCTKENFRDWKYDGES